VKIPGHFSAEINKLVKRRMYGRGKIDLLEARVVGLVDA